MWRFGLLGVVLALTAGSGCHSCGDRRRPLRDWLDSRDSATPTRTAGTDPACRDDCGPLGRPVSYGLSTPVPTGGYTGPIYGEGVSLPAGIGASGRPDELPPPNIPATNLPATPAIAIPQGRGK
jgi:hypothetical protein